MVDTIINIDGDKYRTNGIDFETHSDGMVTSYISVEKLKVTNKCDHCGRFNLEQEVLYSLDELIEHGWLVHLGMGKNLSYPCPTKDCPGDGRYAAPGRRHLPECNYPRDISPGD